MRLAAAVLLAVPLLHAQQPIQVTPCRQGAEPSNLPPCISSPPNYLGAFNDALRQHAEAVRAAQQFQLQRESLDLAKRADQRAQEEHDLRMQQAGAVAPRNGMDLRNWIMQERRDWNANTPGRRQADGASNREVIDSFAQAKTSHDDFAALIPAMEIIADSMTPNWALLTPAEYIESLYAIAKNASFAAAARDVLLTRSSAPAAH